MTYELPYGIKVVVVEPIFDRSKDLESIRGSIVSDLMSDLARPDDSALTAQLVRGRVEALEAFLLSLACAGVNIGSREVLRALDRTVRALAERPDTDGADPIGAPVRRQ